MEAWRSPPGRGSLFGHDRRAEVRQRGPTVMSGNLEVFDAIHFPWTPIGTIVRTGRKGGKITCEPQRPGATASPPSDPQDRP